jgi:hypothetical protein
MAEETRIMEEEARETLDERVLAARPRISWGAVFGGGIAALGIWLLLYAFGLAVGLSTVDANNPGSLKGSGIFTGIWSGVAPIVALFIGGMVAGHLAGVFTRGYGALHGLVMWGLVALGGAVMVFAVVSSVVAGAASVGAVVVKGGGAAIKGAGTSLNLDWNDALAPVNQRLQAQGKPPVTAQQMEAASKDALAAAVRSGHFDRTQFESALAQNTALTRADVQQLSQQAQAKFDQAAGAAKMGALKAADATGKAFWGIFGALALGLLAALGGGALGVPRLHMGEPRRMRRVVTQEPPPRRPLATPRPVYPTT